MRLWTVDAVAFAPRPAEMVRDGNQSTSTKAFAKHGPVAKSCPLGALEPLGLAYPNIGLVPPRPFYIQSLHTQPCGLTFSLNAKYASLLTCEALWNQTTSGLLAAHNGQAEAVSNVFVYLDLISQ